MSTERANGVIVYPPLAGRVQEAGMAGRSEIRTMFEFIDVDEGRSLPDALGFEPRKTAFGAVAALAYLPFR